MLLPQLVVACSRHHHGSPWTLCTFSISPTTAVVGSGGDAGTVTVATGAGCSWTAASSASWLTVTGGASGSGNGTVTYAVAANTATSGRTGSLTVAGQSVTVTQDAASPVTGYPLTILAHEDGTCVTGFPSQGPGSITTRRDSGGAGKGKKNGRDKKDQIFLTQTDTDHLEVIDGVACDGDAAQFMLPPNGTDTTLYTVWVTTLGGLEASDRFTTCGRDPSDDTIVCSTENTLRIRNKPHHRDVTRALTTITGDFDANPDTPDETLSLFDDALYGYFWDYDGSGLRRVQLRFYPVY